MVNVYEAQRVHKTPPKDKLEQLLRTKKYIATQKVDGYWTQLVKDNNEVHLYSRIVSKKTGYYADNIDKVPHIRKWAEDYLPNGTVLLGEAYVIGGTSKDVTRILGSLPDKAIARQEEEGVINLWLHDILAWKGEDYVMEKTTYSRRYSNLCEYIDINPNVPIPSFVQVAPCYDNIYIDLPKKAEEIISNGGEGLVLVDEQSYYRPKGRTLDMFKIKRHDTLDAIVTRVIPPTMVYSGKEPQTWNLWAERTKQDRDGTYSYYRHPVGENMYDDAQANPDIFVPVTADWYYNKPNAIGIGAYDGDDIVEFATVSSGFTEEDKNSLRDKPDDWIGSVVEIAVMSVDKNAHSVRHPVFVKQRPDKPSEDCTMKVIFD